MLPINIYIYSRPAHSLTDSDGLSTTTDRKTAPAGRQPRTENTPKSRLKPRQSSPRSENGGKQRKSALYIALYDPLQAHNRLKISLKRSSKNVKKLYNITFFEILAFFAEILTTSKNNYFNRLKTRRPSAGQQQPQTAPQTPDPRGVTAKFKILP